MLQLLLSSSMVVLLAKLLLPLNPISSNHRRSPSMSSIKLHDAVVDLNGIEEAVVDLLALAVSFRFLHHFFKPPSL